jgi:hypothetical protein
MSQLIRIAKCLGEDNVQKAVEDILGEEDGWMFHSCVASGIVDVADQGGQGLAIRQQPIMMSTFMVFFEKHRHNA